MNSGNHPLFSITHYRRIFCLFLIATLTCSVSLGYAQSFYPDEIGNTWSLRSVDNIDERTVTIKATDLINGEEVKIIEDDTNGNISQIFIKTEPDGVKLFRSIVTFNPLGEVTLDYSPPQIFLPIPIELGSKWTVEGETEIPLAGKVGAINRAEVVAIEDVVVPAGTFRNSLKIAVEITLDLGIVQLFPSSTMWLAPDVGLVKSTDTNEIIFELISFNIANRPDVSVQPKGKLATTWGAIKEK